MTKVTLCRDCQHWHWTGTFDLDVYDRTRSPQEWSSGWADGVCTLLKDKLSITCFGGSDGCTVEYVEADANFWCAFGKPRIENTKSNV